MKKLIIFGLLLTLMACGTATKKKSKEEERANLNRLEKELYAARDGMVDMVKADSMIVLYKEFAAQFPSDSMAVKYLFKAAEVEMGADKNKDCIATLSLIQEKYPDADIMPMVLHFKAFVYDDKLQEFDKAKACLDELIENYPDDPLVSNAKAYRNLIGKDPNEIFGNQDTLQIN